ncbi:MULTISPECIES: NAD(P)-binding domain-containing protein [unclassified Halomonas]|uniref:NAD(P)-binding domain-containing protein n=1 Tax=unclassified Halomonas TaxID=2609666 RepID=UPI00209CBA02|nr:MULTISPECIES: NAD(P)/FAD-dependent oxidoreductase [unclassified Halomonas]MCP1313892.1 NAD(P)/FAD-dependent oxidoreductase [Halomonas sp. 707D7]MCP1327263.1 NAD(P)/FAD-dependent oxidoreductase [Halomonas sp. 707D4]
MTQTSISPTLAGAGLDALDERVRFDLACLNLPPASWVPSRTAQGDRHVHDVVIIGGGQCGLVAAFALLCGGIRDLRVFDRNPEGLEGPWMNYARMETLRSPKTLPGPSYGFASLTFRAWFEAQFGTAEWEALDKIPRPMWMAYLRWYRQVLALPVENEVNVDHVAPCGEHLELTLSGPGARQETVLTRKLVMATGRDGTGGPKIPGFVEGLPSGVWAHTADEIDFKALEGKRVIVVGVGASAIDNAAEALEHGAEEVRFLIRRAQMPTINKMMGIGSFGFTHGYASLPDAWRWRIMHYSFITQTPPPRGSTLRVSRHENAHFHFECGVEATHMEGDEIVVTTRQGEVRGDFLILGTGFEIDPLARTELEGYADQILLWRDRYRPPAELAHDELGKFPYVGRDFAFQEREPGAAPWLADIHCFNYGASVSLGKVSGDIPGISEGASWLAGAIAASFYQKDVECHWRKLNDYASPELEGDEWRASPLPGAEIDQTRQGGAQ